MTHIVRAFVRGLSAILVLAGCSSLPQPQACPACPAPAPSSTTARPVEAKYQQTAFAAIPGWADAPLAPGLRAFASACSRIADGSALRRACDAARALPAADENAARVFLEANFNAWALANADGSVEGMVTGYYEPVLAGSRTRSERFRYPVYGVPADLVAVELDGVVSEVKGLRLRGRLEGARLVPYWTRGEIEDSARAVEDSARAVGEARAKFSAPVLAWVEDPVELFFLQIQGSGQIELGSGARVRLGYGDQNGHPYASLGRYLMQRGELALEQTSMQGIKAWAATNPGKLRAALDSNPSYVFFREAAEGSGPLGTLGAPLTAGYSLAIDPRSVPLGAPVFLATTMPLSSQPLRRLMAAQDTGGAIRGAVRADFYWGTGNEAGALAGRMRQQGRMWILWPRGEGAPR